MNTTHLVLQTWVEARTRFTNLLNEIKEEDLTRKLSGTTLFFAPGLRKRKSTTL